MEFEFQESDIVFSNNQEQDRLTPGRIVIRGELDKNYLFDFEGVLAPVNGNPRVQSECQKDKKNLASSPPVNIPNNFLRSAYYSDGLVEDDGDDGGEVIPPHLIVGRRVAGKIASSMSTNSGRMMKGRYMSEFRDSILRMTGFLES